MSKITEILSGEGIAFQIEKDQDIEDFNRTSMRNDLRHYTPPNISTHILAIYIQDEDFQKLSDHAKKKLLEFGITDQAPAPEDFIPSTDKTIHKDLADGPGRLIGSTMKHQLAVGVILLAIYFLLEYMGVI